MKKLGKYSRSVSIIGVGCTPFMNTIKNPSTNGLTESELYGYAAIDAMKDAGITPKDLQFYVHGQAGAIVTSDQNAANVHVNDWFGAHGLGSFHHSEACCTGYMGLDLAVQLVASGKYDMVLSGCVDMGATDYVPNLPAHHRQKLTREGFQRNVERVYDRAYTRQFECGQWIQQDDFIMDYMQKYGVSFSDMDDAMNGLAISNRRNAARNPRALFRTEFAELAKQAGFDNVWDYMRSEKTNPFATTYLRRTGMEARADGAAACIICPTEIAKQYTAQPIEVLGFGNSVVEAMHPHLEEEGTREAIRQVYEVTGVKPEEIDMILVNDFFLSSSLMVAEEAGFIPRGESWKYARDGRLAFDGDRPMNTGGGRCSFGHAHAASGMSDVFEAVTQMRGLAGDRQMPTPPRTVMLRGFGGGQNLCAGILRTLD